MGNIFCPTRSPPFDYREHVNGAQPDDSGPLVARGDASFGVGADEEQNEDRASSCSPPGKADGENGCTYKDQRRGILDDPIHEKRWDEVLARIRSDDDRDEAREDLRRRDDDESSGAMIPLHWACRYGAPYDVVRAMLESYPEAASVANVWGSLPLHYACGDRRASVRVVRLLLDYYPEGARSDDQGRLPLHIAVACNVSVDVLKALVGAYPEGACTGDHYGTLPIHWLAFRGSPFDDDDVEKARVLLAPVLRHEGACRAADWKYGMLPLHVAAEFGLPVEVLRTLLLTYEGAAMATCATPRASAPCADMTNDVSARTAVRLECGHVRAKSLDGSPPRWRRKLSHAYDDDDARRNLYALDLLERLRPEGSRTDKSTSYDEFDEKSDLLFSFNPNIAGHRSEQARLSRFVDRISREARKGHLSEPSRRVWVWMCTFRNAEDPTDNYVRQINAILDGLDRTDVEWLASVETPGVRQIREIAAPPCAKAINAQLLFAGRLELSRDPPMHKSTTCIVVDARDYGNPATTIIVDGGASPTPRLNTYSRVVVKFMSNPKQFDREIGSRNLGSVTRSSEVSSSPFLVPAVTYFDTRESSEVDSYYRRDIGECKDSFGHDLVRYPYAVVMKRADRNFDSIYRHEKPRMLKIRAYMEVLANKLEGLHSSGRIHADIKLLNIVRLDDVLTLIDMDASRKIAEEKVGTKFSSGVLPPEMIHELEDEKQENEYIAYWQKEYDAFRTLQNIVQESNVELPDAVSELLEEKRFTDEDHVECTLDLYSEQSETLKDLFETGGRRSEAFYQVWANLTENAGLWEKISPRESKEGKKYVVKTFRHGCETGLPYSLLDASVSVDMWSFGILLYKLCTKRTLFGGNEVTDDLDSGDSFAELANWGLDTAAWEAKLALVTNESAFDLLQILLSRNPNDRPKRMKEVLFHEFFETDYNAKRKALAEELCRLRGKAQVLDDQLQKVTATEQELRASMEKQLLEQSEGIRQQLRQVEDEMKQVVNALSPSELIHCRKWGAVRKKLNESDRKDLKGLFLEACRHGPPYEVVRDFLRIDSQLPKAENYNEELPIHLICCYGAETKVVKTLIQRHPKSKTKKSGLDEKSPLEMAQVQQWKYDRDNQTEVINYLRRECCKDQYDDMTDLPMKGAFEEWAHIPQPGVPESNAYAILLFLDISGFKAVNDNASYEAGDDTIKEYVLNVEDACGRVVQSAKKDLNLACDIFRMGGDEFAVVGKFCGDEFVSPVVDVWNHSFKQLVQDLACLEAKDANDPSSYNTFFRIGCCAGRVSCMKQLLAKAEEQQKKVKTHIEESTGLGRGESISLAEIREKGIQNFSELVTV